MRTPKKTIIASIMTATLAVAALTGCDAVGQKLTGVLDRIPFLSDSSTASTDSRDSTDASSILTPDKHQAVDDSVLITPGTLTVGVNPNVSGVPLSCVEDGKLVGMDIDLGSALADDMGLKVKFVVVDGTAESLGTACDVVMDQAQDPNGAYKLSDVYGQSAVAVFHKGDMGVAKVEDLSSKNVAVQTGSVPESTLDQTGLTVNKKGYSTLNDAFADLDKGAVDFVLCDVYAGAYLAHVYDDIYFAGTLNAPTDAGVACANDNSVLSSAVAESLGNIKGNGVFDLLRSRWLGDLPVLDATTQIQNVPAKAEPAAPAEGDAVAQPADAAQPAA